MTQMKFCRGYVEEFDSYRHCLAGHEVKIHKPPQDDAVKALLTVSEAVCNLSCLQIKTELTDLCFVVSTSWFLATSRRAEMPPCF